MRKRRGCAAVIMIGLLSACSVGAASEPSSTTSPAVEAPAETLAPSAIEPAPTSTTASPWDTLPPAVSAEPSEGVDSATSVTTSLILNHDGVSRRYRLHIPEGLDGPAALVVDLHGFTATPDNHDALSGWSTLADVEGLVVAQPAALGDLPAWESAPAAQRDLGFIRDVVADVVSKVAIDPGRIYASGFSNGGGMAHRLACDASDLFAAIGTVAGTYLQIEDCAATRPVSVISFHGTADLVVPIQGMSDVLAPVDAWVQTWVERNECAAAPETEQSAGDVMRTRWAGCADDTEVALYVIEGGRHTWPGSRSPGLFDTTRTIDATALMWDFFVDHPMP